jgi:hypothetical protein
MQLHAAFLALSSSIALLTCVDQLAISSSGDIRIRLSTSGSESDRFSVTVDGGFARPLDPNGGITLVGLSPGTHLVLLQGLGPHCVVQGENPRPVEVGARGEARVDFVVRCGGPEPSG